MTQRFFSKKRLKELNLFLSTTQSVVVVKKIDSKNWTLSSDMTQRIEPIFNTTRSIEFFKQKLWLKEFIFFKKNMTQRIELFF